MARKSFREEKDGIRDIMPKKSHPSNPEASREMEEHFLQSGRPAHVTTESRASGESRAGAPEVRSRYADLYDYAPVGYFTFDSHGLVVDVNFTGAQILGVERDYLLNQPFAAFVTAKYRDIFFNHREAVLKTGTKQICEIDIERRDGTQSTILLQSVAGKDREGKFTNCHSSASDITARKWTEESLRKAHDKLELHVKTRSAQLRQAYESLEIEATARILLGAAVEQASEGVLILRKDFVIGYANPSLCRMTGYALSELVGRGIDTLYMDRTDASSHSSMRSEIECTGAWSGIYTIVKKDGAQAMFKINYAPITDPSGEVLNYVVHCQDMTEQIKQEEQHRQAQKMEALGTLAGGVAHDFNNMLSAIIGFTEMALDDLPDEQTVRVDLQNVLKAALRGRELVKQILAFSRKTNGKMCSLQLAPIVKEAAKFLTASLPSTIKIDVALETDSDTVLADPSQVQQVVVNLCANAAHAMNEKGGSIEIRMIDVSFQSDFAPPAGDKTGSYVLLSVRDTGTGMTPEIKKRIFEPFFTTKSPDQGTGMGLAVVYGIVKRLRGSITVESEPGKGSVFNVFIPKAERTDHLNKDEHGEILGGREWILFVDDEEPIVSWARGTLKRLGYKVVGTTDIHEALTIFIEHPDRFDIVITDQIMPTMDGLSLAKEILRVRPDLPIIICAGHSGEPSPEQARAAGISELLTKPLTKREIAHAIRWVLDRENGLTPGIGPSIPS